MTSLAGTLILPHGAFDGTIQFGERITGLDLVGPAADLRRGPLILPGFIDTHVHGGGGADTMDGAAGVRALAAFHVRHGVTTLLPTTITNPWEEVMAALMGVAEVMSDPGRRRAARVHGAHLEGPFINPHRLGAQPPFAVEPQAHLVEEALATGVVRVVTLAPELEHSRAAAASFAAAGTRVSFGHTVASADQVAEVAGVVRRGGGVVGFTHLFNAMTQLGSREPGVVGAALADGEAFAELIYDKHHVAETSFRAAHAAKPDRLHLITDAIRACGIGEGESELGGQRVVVRGGAARLDDGTLAGSVLTLDQALRNALAAGLDLPTVSRALSSVPAAYLGLTDRGAIRESALADLVVLSPELAVERVFVGGHEVDLAA